jgi:Helix-turn-helix domain of transposase family ISL3
METYIRKALRLKAHTVVQVEEDEVAGQLVVHLDRLKHRCLRCGECGLAAPRAAPTRRPPRRWRNVAMREHVVEFVYAPWADKWQRVTHALARAVAALARGLDWTSVATHFRLNWKTVTAIVEGAVLWGWPIGAGIRCTSWGSTRSVAARGSST